MPHNKSSTKNKGTTTQQVRDMVNLYIAGYSLNDIARIYGLAQSTVQYHLKKQEDLELRPSGGSNPVERLSHDEIRKAVYLYHNCGYTSTEVGRIMGIKPQAVCYRLQKAGAPARPAKLRNAKLPSGHEFMLHV